MSLFISHGAPTLLLDDTPAHRFLKALGRDLPRPKGIIFVSAHWESRDLRIGSGRHHALIRDFSGFPEALHTFAWPAQGDPALARAIQQRLGEAGFPALLDPKRGLDHGAWVPLALLDPNAQVPVVPVSLPVRFTGEALWWLGATLARFEAEGYLLIGSGSLTHNLRARASAWQAPVRPEVQPFLEAMNEALGAADRRELQQWQEFPGAHWHHPSPEHFLPLLIAAAAPGPAKRLHHSVEYGILAMDCWRFGYLTHR